MSTHQPLSSELGKYQAPVNLGLEDLAAGQIMKRIWAHDHTVWSHDPQEIANRLGWLDIADRMLDQVPRLEATRKSLLDQGFTDVLLLGMGGSSLAPEVFQKTFGSASHGLNLRVLDSTDPDAVRLAAESLPLSRTVFIVATKSGGTTETLSFFKYFYNLVTAENSGQNAGAQFIAITDPGSKLAALAEKYNFREIYLNDPNIGGRYSALSFFGLVAAGLVGLDLNKLLSRARAMANRCSPSVDVQDNPGAILGVILGSLALEGLDKLTFVTSPEIASFEDWIEQLIAESTGKEGRGILPVVGEPLGPPEIYAGDRVFVHLALAGDSRQDAALGALKAAGFPVVRIDLEGRYDLGGQFFLWEMATAVAGWRLGIQPFDQPNVEEAKVLARMMVQAYQESGSLPVETPQIEAGNVQVFGSTTATDPVAALHALLQAGRTGVQSGGRKPGYAAVQAFIPPGPAALNLLQELRTLIRDRFRLATTVGFGPRFLHSTGQLHKGDAGHGLFIQITSDPSHDIPVPDEAGGLDSSISFGVLIAAQAMGDRQALLDAGRDVLRFHLGRDLHAGLHNLVDQFQKSG